MNNIWMEIAQTTQKKRAEEINFEFWVEWQGNTRSTNNLSSCIVFHPTVRAEQECLVSIFL
jgi:hypothetical protein